MFHLENDSFSSTNTDLSVCLTCQILLHLTRQSKHAPYTVQDSPTCFILNYTSKDCRRIQEHKHLPPKWDYMFLMGINAPNTLSRGPCTGNAVWTYSDFISLLYYFMKKKCQKVLNYLQTKDQTHLSHTFVLMVSEAGLSLHAVACAGRALLPSTFVLANGTQETFPWHRSSPVKNEHNQPMHMTEPINSHRTNSH